MTAPFLRSFLAGGWVAGSGTPLSLLNPATEEVVAAASSSGLDCDAALRHARTAGGAGLRRLDFKQRGELLKALAARIHECRDELIDCGIRNAGNTRNDAKFDVDGAAAVCQAYGELAETLPAAGQGWLRDGAQVPLGRTSKSAGQHVLCPIEGVAVLINAYNFPAWGMLEKAACAWLAGVPVLAKPATATALMAHRLVEILLESRLLPDGALSLLVGPVGDLLERLDERDAVAFTGSSATGAAIRGLAGVRARSLRLNVEADSLNAALLGPDVTPGSDTFHQFVNDVARDMTQKAGQKCTAARRLFVPEGLMEAVTAALAPHLEEARAGDPALEGVRMGPLATRGAREAVQAGLARLLTEADVACAGRDDFLVRDGFAGKGFFQAPVLLRARDAAAARAVHEVEVFGPVATLLAYGAGGERDAVAREVLKGGGSLVASVYSDDREFLRRTVRGIAAGHGRVYVGSRKSAGGAGPGTALPQLKHGGPGRAGGGEELAGERGLHFYMQRVALQGYGPLLEWIAGGD